MIVALVETVFVQDTFIQFWLDSLIVEKEAFVEMGDQQRLSTATPHTQNGTAFNLEEQESLVPPILNLVNLINLGNIEGSKWNWWKSIRMEKVFLKSILMEKIMKSISRLDF